MNFKTEEKPAFTVIGFERIFENRTAYAQIPKFWDEIFNTYSGKHLKNAYEKAIAENRIGEYGVCIDDLGNGKFRYLIAGKYAGGEVPEGMVLHEFPKGTWAIFDLTGALPDALQEVNTRIFTEWLPKNGEYELSQSANIEWYDCEGDTSAADYHSAIWIPIKRAIGR